MTEWKPVEGIAKDYWKPEKPGDERQGKMLRCEPGEYKGRATTQYVIQTDKGEMYTPNHAVLNGKLIQVKAGQFVKIVYLGTAEKTKKGKAAAELYDVFVSDQTDLETPPQDNTIGDLAGKILQTLKQAPAGMQDGAFWDTVTTIVGNMSGSIKIVDKLKAEGKITQEHGTWRAT